MYKNYLDDETGMSAGPPSHRVHCSNQETGEEFGCIGGSMIHLAAYQNNTLELEKLLQNGADINLIYKTVPPLYIATIKNNLDVVKMLIKYKCDVNAKSVEVQQTALHSSVSRGYMEITKTLCCHGANINQRDHDGSTPLMLAATNAVLEAVDYLTNRGADINLANRRGLSPLAMAVQNGNVEVVRYLLEKGADTNILDTQGNNALFHAVKGGQELICRMLINAGTNVHMHNHAMEYPITVAAMYGNTPITNLLINAGCDVNVTSKYGTSVYSAVERQHINVLRRLIMAGADVGKTGGSNPRLPLVEALHQHTPSYDVIMELLRAGTDIDAAVCECHTSPINMILAKCNMPSIVLILQVDAKLRVADYKMEEFETFCPIFFTVFKHLMSDNVTSLKGICRKAIKNSIGTVHYKKKVESIALPRQLQDYLLHCDVLPSHDFIEQYYKVCKCQNAAEAEAAMLPRMMARTKLRTHNAQRSNFRIVKS